MLFIYAWLTEKHTLANQTRIPPCCFRVKKTGGDQMHKTVMQIYIYMGLSGKKGVIASRASASVGIRIISHFGRATFRPFAGSPARLWWLSATAWRQVGIIRGVMIYPQGDRHRSQCVRNLGEIHGIFRGPNLKGWDNGWDTAMNLSDLSSAFRSKGTGKGARKPLITWKNRSTITIWQQWKCWKLCWFNTA